VSTKPKKSTRRRATAGPKPKSKPKSTARRRRPAAPAPEVEAFEAAVDFEAAPPPSSLTPVVVEHEPVVQLTIPEPSFAARVPGPTPDRPHPDHRRAIFFDVENTSRAEAEADPAAGGAGVAAAVAEISASTASRASLVSRARWSASVRVSRPLRCLRRRGLMSHPR
jgi:hypothetical protein